MAQPSVVQFFNTRKRPATNDYKIEHVKKILKLDKDELENEVGKNLRQQNAVEKNGTVSESTINKSFIEHTAPKNATNNTNEPIKGSKTIESNSRKTQGNQPQKMKTLLAQSSKLDKLKKSIDKFKKSAEELKSAEKKTNSLLQSPKLNTFKSLEFEVLISPTKPQSPEKPYLSPKKASSARRNLLNSLSPTKSVSAFTQSSSAKDNDDATIKTSLALPFKYKSLCEMFRAVDTVVQILHNRKETVTFKKLKPAVEEMTKRTFTQKYLAQIKNIYPDAFNYTQEKVRVFQTGLPQLQWDLVLMPKIDTEVMTTQVVLDRRRELNHIMVEKIKEFHNEFLLSLTPPMIISKDKITRWHPEFDLEKVPEIEQADLPQPPFTEKYTTGKEVLESARRMFNCNTRMNKAISNLKEMQEKNCLPQQEIIPKVSEIKGIPKDLLEKVRQKQAAKALMSMTTPAHKEKELQMYSRLPEIARLLRNLFVTEKKMVLELDVVIEKLGGSYRSFLTKNDIQSHLETISKEVPDWLKFHKLRNSVFLKLAKNADLSVVLNKLEKAAQQKNVP